MTATLPREPEASEQRPALTREERRRLSEGARAERRLGWTLCAPAVVVMVAVAAFPMGYAIYLSLERYDLRFPHLSKFIGFSNYGTVLSNTKYWWYSFFVTLIITVISVAIEFVLGMAFALLMHRTLVARGAVRTIILIPYGMVTVILGYGWAYAWTPNTGYLSNLFGHSAPLTHTGEAIGLIILAEVWKTTPFMALLLLAGLALVNEDLLQAARVDGANTWQRFIHITLPLMKPAILVALLFRTLDAFRIFDNIYALTLGADRTGSVSFLAYDNLFTGLNLGLGSTISVLIFITVGIIAFVFVKLFGAAAPGSE